MSASWKIASMMILPLSLALAGVGCVAPSDEDPVDGDVASMDEAMQSETTGEAQQGFCGGYGGFGGARYYGGYGGFRGPFLGAPYYGSAFYGAPAYGYGGYGGYGCGRPFYGGACGF